MDIPAGNDLPGHALTILRIDNSSEALRCFERFLMNAFMYGARTLFFNTAAYQVRLMPVLVIEMAESSPLRMCGLATQWGNTATPRPAFTIWIIASVSVIL